MRILFLDDSRERQKCALRWMTCDLAETAAGCIAALKVLDYDLVFLDHDLGGEQCDTLETDGPNGMDVVRFLCERGPRDETIIVHTLNPAAGPVMVERLREAGFRVKRWPFTALLEHWRSAPEQWVRYEPELGTR